MKRTYTILLSCGHIRSCFSRKPGPGYYCNECKDKRDCVAEVT